MAQDKLWFSHSIEGLFARGLGARDKPELEAKLRAAGIDLNKLEPAYPVTKVIAAARTVLPMVWPHLSEAEQHRQLGVAFMTGYAQTFLGSAMVQVMKLIGPRRTLERMQKNLRTGGNYIETRFKAVGATEVELWLSDTSGIPGMYVGIVEEGGRMVGAKNIRVQLEEEKPPECVLRVTWDP